MALRFELKDGDRTVATYTNKLLVGRMLDVATEAKTAPAKRKPSGSRRRKALGKGAAQEQVDEFGGV